MKLPANFIRSLPRWLPLAVAPALLLIAGGVYALSPQTIELREGGLAVVKTAPKLAQKISPSDLAAATPGESLVASSCSQNGLGKLVLVSISQQHLWACDGTVLTKDTAVTTGAPDAPKGVDDSTPLGTWHIYSKQTNRYLDGCDVNGCWHDYVQYWLPFDDSVGLHDASWQTFPFGSSQYQTDGSHGCVHLPTDFIAWLYTWAPVGTTVTVAA